MTASAQKKPKTCCNHLFDALRQFKKDVAKTNVFFDVYRNDDFFTVGPVTYNGFITKKNADISLTTGTFTCRIPGYYEFTFTSRTGLSDELGCSLYRNTRLIGSVYNTGKRHSMESNTVLVYMKEKDIFYVNLNSGFISDDKNQYTHFVGKRVTV